MGIRKTHLWDMVGAYPVCTACGSRKITREALAAWNMATQAWELQTILDDFCCEDCGRTALPAWKLDAEFRRKRIQRLNDALRLGDPTNATIVVTAGLRAEGEDKLHKIMDAVRCFSEFSEDNDPHGEHDFGAVEHDGEKVFWKIDYFDHALKMHSPDAANPAVTHRVLTLMLASEY